MLEQQAAAQQERLSNAAHGPAVPLGCYTFIATLWVSNRSLTRCTSPRPSRIPLSLIALSVVALAIYSDKGTQGAALPRTSVIGIALSLAVLTADRDLSNHRALAAAMPEVESAADMLRTPGRPFTRGYISEALDRAYNRARMTQAGIDIPRATCTTSAPTTTSITSASLRPPTRTWPTTSSADTAAASPAAHAASHAGCSAGPTRPSRAKTPAPTTSPPTEQHITTDFPSSGATPADLHNPAPHC